MRRMTAFLSLIQFAHHLEMRLLVLLLPCDSIERAAARLEVLTVAVVRIHQRSRVDTRLGRRVGS